MDVVVSHGKTGCYHGDDHELHEMVLELAPVEALFQRMRPSFKPATE
jgi:hypothetical protein